ncbi:hypothetical protein CDV31_006471 [Fusarium ambrosium]|uniref:Uncharacterized protein n=1 Tax=Fusarium ambrosium TaxID=131363 RepID=A0A428UCL1_9HYPO|nr:hypothetical protein CDV31_006471 [Fusarium ambrosium]
MASASGVFLAFLSLALFTSVLAATENLEPSALPTLPPANPDISKDPCAFSDIDKLMYRLENTSLSYNTSLLVETCDDICRLLYGVGNPDILGIGAMVSYALQGIVAMTFGPCLLIIYMFWGETRHGLFKLLLRLTIPTHRANAFTAVCVLISLAIRLFGKAPAFERRFCGTFAVYQLFVSGVGIAFYFFFHRFKDRVQSILFIALFGASVISCLAGFGVQMLHIPGAMNVLAGRTEGGAEFFSSPPQKIFTDCHEMKGFPWAHPGEDNFASGEVTGLCVGSIVLLLGFVVLFIWKQKRLDQANKHASTSSRFSRFNLARTALLILPFLITASTGSALVRMFMAMQKIRQDIQKYGKDEYKDNEWGFGQVMAVIVWVQYVGDLVTILIAAFTNDDEEKTSQGEREDVAPAANINQPRREASQATSSSPVPDQTGNMDSVEQQSNQSSAVEMPTMLARQRSTWTRNGAGTYLPA